MATADAPESLSPYAERFHRRSGLGPDAMGVRRREDRAAAALLGAETLHLELPDAVYREDPATGRPLYRRLTALLGRPRAGDPLGEQLRRRLGELPDSELLLLPLALGGHVDHRITRTTAEAVFGGRNLVYWEDFPYVDRWTAWGPRLPGRGWRAELVALGPDALAARCQAMEAYASQVRMLFRAESEMRRRVERQLGRRGGERYWRPG